MTKDPKSSQPKEADVMSAILKEMGIHEYEPGVVNQMLEFTYRYVSQILDDSRAYANYSKKAKTIDIDDVKLAIHMNVEKSLTTPPPRDLLLELSRTRNTNPLPGIKPQCGVRLPPDRYCLSACNMQLKPTAKKGSKLNSLKTNISLVTTKTGTNPPVTLVQKSTPSAAAAASPKQKVIAVNRPLIKLSGASGASSPKIHISSGPGVKVGVGVGGIKKEDQSDLKRKREDEDYDAS